MEWVNLRKHVPYLHGIRIHVVEDSAQQGEIQRALEQLGFSVHQMNGRYIFDETSFFEQVRQAFHLDSPPIKNWDAFVDALNYLDDRPDMHVALIWNNYHQLMNSDPQTFVTAVCELNQMVMGFGTLVEGGPPPKQIVVVLCGCAEEGIEDNKRLNV